MPVLRRTPREARVLLSDTSPYGSRVLDVEYDHVATAAYLRTGDGETVAATWVANHQEAPFHADLARLNAGLVPAMPSGRTKHPKGRPPFDPRTLEVVWFEEGDGVALLENGQPICVIPSWSDIDHGVPGYSREAIGRSPFAFALDDEIDELGPRILQAQAFWDWRNGPGAWEGFQQSLLGHLLSRLGPGGYYWHDVGRRSRTDSTPPPPGAVPAPRTDGTSAPATPRAPLVGVSERPARGDRAYNVLTTVGMSCQRMPTVELYEDNVGEHARIELAVATMLPSVRAGSVFPWLAQYPWQAVTSFAPGDNVKWYHEARTFPLGPAWEGVLLLDDPNRLAGPDAPDLTSFSFGGDPVQWLWLVPVTEDERQFGKQEGPDALIERLARDGRSWVVGSE
ncbi:suppressor of fused domain protein [Actinomadura sp. DC4]|uniref:suppressor of fused domain protein n=1 Tax=Actinomadura sp. DC4 TaxID=3055069 RepID=UPI0025B084A6|nr:suppressor of fused domain protein [Actinomadura sp. DC4]MDN3356593.1 suppressor of fused domain protein [Actinomadura sp. DC4]